MNINKMLIFGLCFTLLAIPIHAEKQVLDLQNYVDCGLFTCTLEVDINELDLSKDGKDLIKALTNENMGQYLSDLPPTIRDFDLYVQDHEKLIVTADIKGASQNYWLLEFEDFILDPWFNSTYPRCVNLPITYSTDYPEGDYYAYPIVNVSNVSADSFGIITNMSCNSTGSEIPSVALANGTNWSTYQFEIIGKNITNASLYYGNVSAGVHSYPLASFTTALDSNHFNLTNPWYFFGNDQDYARFDDIIIDATGSGSWDHNFVHGQGLSFGRFPDSTHKDISDSDLLRDDDIAKQISYDFESGESGVAWNTYPTITLYRNARYILFNTTYTSTTSATKTYYILAGNGILYKNDYFWQNDSAWIMETGFNAGDTDISLAIEEEFVNQLFGINNTNTSAYFSLDMDLGLYYSQSMINPGAWSNSAHNPRFLDTDVDGGTASWIEEDTGFVYGGLMFLAGDDTDRVNNTWYMLLNPATVGVGDYYEMDGEPPEPPDNETNITMWNRTYRICFDNNTLLLHDAGYANGSFSYNDTYQYCWYGCDNISYACNPTEYEQNLYNFLIILGVFVVIFIVWRRFR